MIGAGAAGTWLGVTIDRILALGDVVVRGISKHHQPSRAEMSVGSTAGPMPSRSAGPVQIGAEAPCGDRRSLRLLRQIR